MRYSLLTQIALIGMSVVIFMTLIKPILTDIGVIQDERIVYQDAVNKAQQLNLKLQELIATRDSFSSNDLSKLGMLLPDTIDSAKVMRDIESIFKIRNIEMTSLGLGENTQNQEIINADDASQQQDSTGVEAPLAQQDFVVTFSGSYEDVKSILSLAETNETLIEVVDLHFGSLTQTSEVGNTPQELESPDTFDFTLTFRSYGLTAPSI